MKLRKFIKNKKNKAILFIGVIVILGVIIGVDFIKSHAYFETSKTYNILKGRIPNFSGGDITLAVKVDGEKREEFPEKGDYIVWSDCSNGMSVDWDYDAWKAKINNDITKLFACNMNFKSYDKFINNITYNGEVVDKYPAKSNLNVILSCNNIDGKWDYNTWKPILNGANKDITCDAKFEDAKELLVTREIIDQGEFKNVTPEYITDGVNGTDGFTVGGMTSGTWNDMGGTFRWEYTLNFDNYNYIKFYAKKESKVAIAAIIVSDGVSGIKWRDESLLETYEVGNTVLTETWTEYIADVSKITGEHIISFIGGYLDGGKYYATSYSNIRFTN